MFGNSLPDPTLFQKHHRAPSTESGMAEHICPDLPPLSSPPPRPPPPTVRGPAGEILRMARQKGAWEKELLSRWQSEDRDWRAAQRTRLLPSLRFPVRPSLRPSPRLLVSQPDTSLFLVTQWYDIRTSDF